MLYVYGEDIAFKPPTSEALEEKNLNSLKNVGFWEWDRETRS